MPSPPTWDEEWPEGIVMRIDRLELRNFKKFAALDLDLHPQFTLLIGENGAGKTSVLDALAVALGVWLVEPPDSTLINSRRRDLSIRDPARKPSAWRPRAFQ